MMLKNERNWWVSGIVIVTTCLVVVLYVVGAFASLQARFTDRFFTSSTAPSDIILIAIDEASLAEIGQWPFARATHAAMLQQLHAAAVVGFDVIFAEPSALGDEDDAIFANAIASFDGHVVLPQVFDEQTQVIRDPIPILAASTTLGYVNTRIDRDGVVRQAQLQSNGHSSFDAAVLQAYGRPVVSEENRLIYYRGPERTFVTVSYVDVLRGVVPAEVFTGTLVLVGASAAGLGDTFQTPFGAMAGVEIHANTIAGVLENKQLVAVAPWIGIFLLLLVALLVVTALTYARQVWQLVLAGIVIPLVIIISAYGSFAFGYVVPHFYLLLLFVLLFGALLLVQYIFENKEKAFIRRGFEQYVDADVVAELTSNPEKLTLGGETRNLAILFSDIRSFTTISESLTPQELMTQLNEYLSAMSDVIMDRRGLVDKYIGDAVMAFWGAPLVDPQRSVHACESVLAMHHALTKLNAGWQEEGRVPFAIGVGISTGDVVVGNMGSRRRFNYSIIGDEVNFAARLEGLTKQYGVMCIIGEKTYQDIAEVNHLYTRELDDVMVKGKTEPKRIYELIVAAMTPAREQLLTKFKQGRQYYKDGLFAEAITAFEAALIIDPEDGPSKVFLERSVALAKDPPATWDGVYAFTTK